MYTRRKTFVATLRQIRNIKRLLSLVLVVAILATNSAWAAVDVADLIDHGLKQGQTLPNEPGNGDIGVCKHGCVGHMVVHLSAPLSEAATADKRPAAARVASTSSLSFVFLLPDLFFRPPRVLLD